MQHHHYADTYLQEEIERRKFGKLLAAAIEEEAEKRPFGPERLSSKNLTALLLVARGGNLTIAEYVEEDLLGALGYHLRLLTERGYVHRLPMVDARGRVREVLHLTLKGRKTCMDVDRAIVRLRRQEFGKAVA